MRRRGRVAAEWSVAARVGRVNKILDDSSRICLTPLKISSYDRPMRTQDILDQMAAGLKGAKGAAGVSNKAAAEILGVSQGTIAYRLRTASQDLYARDFIDLCRVYGADPERIFYAAFDSVRKVNSERELGA